MKIPNRCPVCGSTSWRCINVYYSGFSFWRSLICGALFGDRIGLWAGLSGKRKKVYMCPSCGIEVEYE